MNVAVAVVLVCLSGLLYAAFVERNAFRLRRVSVPVLAAGSAPLTLLHLSDVHMRPKQRRKQAFLRALAAERPDLVVNTGDNLGSADGVPAMLESMAPFAGVPGAFVLGSNDYYAPRWKSPLRYLVRGHKRIHGVEAPWRDLAAGFEQLGWANLTNRSTTLSVNGGRRLAVAGVDDPHLKRDDKQLPKIPAQAGTSLALGLVHAPEPRVLDPYAASGYQLLLAGHTHGGQLRLPGVGALVTNCGIDRARARGLSRYAGAWLHVSPGLGTSPYAPVRFACRPEATLLTLVAVEPD